jgi:hypothetical protein
MMSPVHCGRSTALWRSTISARAILRPPAQVALAMDIMNVVKLVDEYEESRKRESRAE